VLPNFLIIGAMKSGTTTLYHLLKSHPAIYMAEVKEPRFFSLEKNMASISWYESLFDSVTVETAIGEASTNYTKYPVFKKVPERIKRHIPDVKLIYIVRNPVERAYSEFTYNYSTRGVEINNPHDAIVQNSSYINISKYFMQLNRYLEVFDRSQIKVILLEDLKGTPGKTIKTIYDFLDVDTEFTPLALGEHKHQTKNRAGQRRAFAHALRKFPLYDAASHLVSDNTKGVLNRLLRKKVDPPQKMTMADREYLIDHLKEDVLSMQEYLDRDLSAWLR